MGSRVLVGVIMGRVQKFAPMDGERSTEATVTLEAIRRAKITVDWNRATDVYTIQVPKGLPFPLVAGLPAFQVSGEMVEDLAHHLGPEGAFRFMLTVKRPWDRDKILGYRREHGGPIHD